MIIAKFGGTSMGSAQVIGQVADILEKMSGEKAAVVSATSGTTDKLIALAEAALAGGDFEVILAEIIGKHEKIVEELGIGGKSEDGVDGVGGVNRLNLEIFWTQIRKLVQGISLIGELSLSARDHLLTFGERISVHLLAGVLNKRGLKAEACDAFNFVFTDNNFGEANVDFEKTNKAVVEKIGGLLKRGVIPVITGFVGQSAGPIGDRYDGTGPSGTMPSGRQGQGQVQGQKNGHYITLGRGGSDYTGAIIGAALGASEVQIWTDVDGILNTDPRLVPEAKVLPQVSFNEAGELAYFGAKVLHPKTIKPAIEKNIPVKILNTFNPSAPGTLITNEEDSSLKAVTYKKGISIINVASAGMLEAKGFLAKLFEVFARHEISVDVVSTSEVSVSLTVENNHSHAKGGQSAAEKVLDDLREFATVEVQDGMAIVCLVGGGIISNHKVLGELFSAVSEHDVWMVSQGASKRNVTFIVKEEEAQEVVRKVFNRFFK